MARWWNSHDGTHPLPMHQIILAYPGAFLVLILLSSSNSEGRVSHKDLRAEE